MGLFLLLNVNGLELQSSADQLITTYMYIDSLTTISMCILIYFAVIRTLTGHKANIRCLDFHPYGDFVASGSLDTNVKVHVIQCNDNNDYTVSLTKLCLLSLVFNIPNGNQYLDFEANGS